MCNITAHEYDITSRCNIPVPTYLVQGNVFQNLENILYLCDLTHERAKDLLTSK